MELFSQLLPKILAWFMSIMDAGTLRQRLFEQKEEHELMWTALDDIARMYKDHPSSDFAKATLTKVKTRYGR